MFGIPGKAAVTLTPAAIRQIARLMAREDSQGLRIGVKKGGCAGMEYTMDYVSSRSIRWTRWWNRTAQG
jgi:iron-sulfur cluster assembly protein